MPKSPKTLFDPGVPSEELHSGFKQILTSEGSEPTRWMLDDIYAQFPDPDGNFVQQFQTAGFDARFFELYLFAYFARCGFAVDRSHSRPDFLISQEGLTVAVEATTVNPSTSGVIAKLGKTISDLTPDEMLEYQQDELPIRFGSPLFSKLQAKYWELDQCKDMPLVFAIEAFHDKESLAFTDAALSTYAYGMNASAAFGQDAKLNFDWKSIDQHAVGSKQIPSNFFGQPDTEHISAIIFTNTGTTAKFARMGYQSGVGCDTITIFRQGHCLNMDPDALDPTWFEYHLDAPPFVESWGQGLVVLHNPECLHPIPQGFFPDAVETRRVEGKLRSEAPGWHPFVSRTIILHLGEGKEKLQELTGRFPDKAPVAVGAITRSEFRQECGGYLAENPITEEVGWFAEETNAFLGVVLRDKIDDDWGYVVLARDQYFTFRAIDVESSLPSRDMARRALQQKIVQLLRAPQRVFPQTPDPRTFSSEGEEGG